MFGGLPGGEVKSHILRGLDFAYREEYECAGTEFALAVELDEQNPGGYLFQAGLLHLYMNDFATYDMEDQFYEKIEKTVKKAKALIARSPTDPWGYFCLGGAYSYLTFHYAQQKKYWWALQYGIRASKQLQRSLELKPDLYDAYLGIGSYHYFQGEVKERLPFLSEGKETGLREIRLAVDRGLYLKVPAKDGLSLVLLREGRYEEALRLAQELVHEYPDSRSFLWTLSKVHFEKGDWEEAERSFRRLLSRIEESQPQNLYNILFCRMRIAQTYYQRGMFKETEREARGVLELAAHNSKQDLGPILGEIKSLLSRTRNRRGDVE